MGTPTLTYAQAVAIRELSQQGHKTRELAHVYGVSTETIRRVIRGDTWGINREITPLTPTESAHERMIIEIAEKRSWQAQEDAKLDLLSKGIVSPTRDQLREAMKDPITGAVPSDEFVDRALAYGHVPRVRAAVRADDTRAADADSKSAEPVDLTDIQDCLYFDCPGKMLCIGVADKLCALHPEFKGA